MVEGRSLRAGVGQLGGSLIEGEWLRGFIKGDRVLLFKKTSMRIPRTLPSSTAQGSGSCTRKAVTPAHVR